MLAFELKHSVFGSAERAGGSIRGAFSNPLLLILRLPITAVLSGLGHSFLLKSSLYRAVLPGNLELNLSLLPLLDIGLLLLE